MQRAKYKVILLDISKKMSHTENGGKRRLEIAKAVAREAILMSHPFDTVGLVLR